MSRPLGDLRGPLSPGPSELTPAAEVAALRREFEQHFPGLAALRGLPMRFWQPREIEVVDSYYDRATGNIHQRIRIYATAPGADPDWVSAEELEAGILDDLERWGPDPWGLE